jgi:hypothetical protein
MYTSTTLSPDYRICRVKKCLKIFQSKLNSKHEYRRLFDIRMISVFITAEGRHFHDLFYQCKLSFNYHYLGIFRPVLSGYLADGKRLIFENAL